MQVNQERSQVKTNKTSAWMNHDFSCLEYFKALLKTALKTASRHDTNFMTTCGATMDAKVDMTILVVA